MKNYLLIATFALINCFVLLWIANTVGINFPQLKILTVTVGVVDMLVAIGALAAGAIQNT